MEVRRRGDCARGRGVGLDGRRGWAAHRRVLDPPPAEPHVRGGAGRVRSGFELQGRVGVRGCFAACRGELRAWSLTMNRKKGSKDGRATVSVAAYDAAQPVAEASICRTLRAEIDKALPDATSKVWHGAPVWFVGEVPVAGYSVPAKGGVALLFWNGQAFGDPALEPMGKFRAAQAHFAAASAIKVTPLRRWLKK